MDDPDCDSTWEDDAEDAGDEEDEGAGRDDAGDEDAGELRAARPGAHQSRTPPRRNWRAMQDLCRYRRHYPGLIERDCNGDMPNLSFYKNEICFLPNGCLIEEFLQQWRSRYSLLEDNHSYIQWLFPLREAGVNWHAKPLTLREVEAFKSSKEVRERLVRAYELMLDFYGIQLQDRDTGAVCRAHNYQKRFQNLNWRSHNNLRITRILKSLGELGLERYQAPLARFFLEETLVRRELPAVRQSALDYFVFAVRCRRQRRELLRFAWEHFRPRCQFVWGPHDKLRRLQPLAAPPPRAGPGQAEGGRSPEAGAQGQACGPDRTGAGDSEAESPPGASALEREPEAEAGDRGEDQSEPPSPKETKKRKLEANHRQERTLGEPGPQGASDVEKIAQNLQGCALSQGGQEPGDPEQPCPGPPGTRAAETRKRRKVDGAAEGPQAPAPPAPSTPQERPGAGAEAEEPEELEGPEEPEGPEGPELEEGAQGCLSEGSGQGTARDVEQDSAGAEEPAEP